MRFKISPQIVTNIAKTYQVTTRIFMEYIDNALDSAELLYKSNNNSYPYKIQINIIIDPIKKTVVFEDNCMGMDKESLLRVVEHIGDSEKKGDFTTSGQFGFGIHAYVACAEQIEITTLTLSSSHAYRIKINREAYLKDEEMPDPDILARDQDHQKSGTKVKLANFESDWWRDVTPNVLKEEIEKHFEQLLARENLEINITYGIEEEVCQPFNYDGFLGTKVEREITTLTRNGVVTTIPQPIRVHLKITDNIIPNKRPIFVNKGRRIEEVQAIKSFRNKSNFSTSVWGHKNLTGYIEVAGLLNPTLPRDDFQRSINRQMVYDEILKIEDEINEILKDLNRRSEDATLSKLEDLLSQELAKLARLDNLRFRTQVGKGEDINLTEDPSSKTTIKHGVWGEGNKHRKKTSNEIPVVETLDDSELKGGERKKSGFDVELSDQERRMADGTLVRSDYIEGGAIVIYKSHPDFQERVRKTRQGETLISERLISYLASEIAIQYKDKFFAMHGKQPEVRAILNSRKDQFVDLINFAYVFEEVLQPKVGTNLLTLEAGNREGNHEK